MCGPPAGRLSVVEKWTPASFRAVYRAYKYTATLQPGLNQSQISSNLTANPNAKGESVPFADRLEDAQLLDGSLLDYASLLIPFSTDCSKA